MSKRKNKRSHRQSANGRVQPVTYKIPDVKRAMLAIGRKGELGEDERRLMATVLGKEIGLEPRTSEELDFLIGGFERFAEEVDSGVDPTESLKHLIEQDGVDRFTSDHIL